MNSGESRSRVLLLAGLFVVVTLSLTAWFSVSEPRQPALPLEGKAADDGETVIEASEEDAHPAGEARVVSSDVAQQAHAVGDGNATGRLRIHCVDEVTGKDVPGLTWVVASERGGDKLHAIGVADAHGRASVTDLPENTLLVFTLRRPPHAEGFTAVWLRAGETKDVELRIGRGGRVHGRVVDDGSQPLAGAEITVSNDFNPTFLRGDPAAIPPVAAVTDAEGRYSVDHLSSRPHAVWIVDGKAKPESWNDVVVAAQLDEARNRVGVDVRPGETKELPDIVLPRACAGRGRVVDARGAGVEGALLTLNRRRSLTRIRALGRADAIALPPGAAGFELLGGEILTRAGGAFELRSRGAIQLAHVVRPSGVGQEVSLPLLRPGETADDLRIVLDDVSGFRLELVDSEGRPARVPNPRIYDQDPRPLRGRRRFYEPVRLSLDLGDDRHERVEVRDDGAGGFLAQVDGLIEEAIACTVHAWGWMPKSLVLVPRLQDGGRLRVELQEQACVHVRLRVQAPSGPADPRLRAPLRLKVCLLEPSAVRGANCCGVGADMYLPLVDGERDLLMPVEALRPFHVSSLLHLPDALPVAEEHGLGHPDGAPVVVEIDARTLVLAAREEREPPEPSAPAQHVGSLHASVVDSVTGQPVQGVLASLRDPGGERNAMHLGRSVLDSRIAADKVPAGRWTTRVSARGYRPQEVPTDIRAGETTDLGRIALVPAPRTTLVIEDAEGRPVPKYGLYVHVFDAMDGESVGQDAIQSDDGSITLFGAMPERLLVQATMDIFARQWIPVVLDLVTTHVRLAPWRDVDLRVTGPAADLPGSNLTLIVRPEAELVEQPAAERLHVGPRPFETQELDVAPGNSLLFRCRLAPGRYVVEGRGTMFTIRSRVFDVDAGSGGVRIEVESSR